MTLPSLEWPWAIWCGVPLVAGLLTWYGWQRRSAPRGQWLTLLALRGIFLFLPLLLAARPTWSSVSKLPPARDSVALLMDQSGSMSLEDIEGLTRYRQSVDFVRRQLLPALQAAGLQVRAYGFGEHVRELDGRGLAEARPADQRTNLAEAIATAVTARQPPPLAVVALTDGVNTEQTANGAAATALLENGVPFVGIGVGSDQGPRIVTLRSIHAPPRVPPGTQFRIDVVVQSAGQGAFPPLSMILLRDGKMVDRRTLPAGQGARLFQDGFLVQESEPGRHLYSVRIMPPEAEQVRLVGAEAGTRVNISAEDRWRILFVQGGLTWDYKFIQLAVRRDPALQITGLSRTANESRFFQNVESEEELLSGFPATLEELTKFRVVVLANILPSDLHRAQQELLVKFCGEFGGGVLLMGGAETFHVAWRDSPLEQLLPVRFAGSPKNRILAPFGIQPTSDALRNPVFRISDDGEVDAAWRRLPQFQEVADVAEIKPGAEIWAVQRSPLSHPKPLMIGQRYGSGRSAAICVPYLWRWRLAKESDPRHFDRFWQQLLRFLGGGDVQAVSIQLAQPWLAPNTDITVMLEPRPDPRASATRGHFRFLVEPAEGPPLVEQQVELRVGQATEVTFRVPQEGMYTLRVLDDQQREQGNRMLEIRDLEREFSRTSRDLEHLRQWAQLSQGQALAIESCDDVETLVGQWKQRAAKAYRQRIIRKPIGIDGWMLAVLCLLMGTEWVLRRQWSWT